MATSSNTVTTNTNQTISGTKTFTSINNTTYNLMDGVNNEGSLSTTATSCSLSLASGNDYSLKVGGVNVLQADVSGIVNKKYTFGRDDGVGFNTVSLSGVATNLFPIGYCWEVNSGAVTKPVSLQDLTDTASISLSRGVWAISGHIILNKGNGTYTTATKISALWNIVTGITRYPNAAGVIMSIASTSLQAQHVIPIGTINVVVTTANAVQTLTRNLTMTVGTTTSWQVNFTGVKIA